MKLSQKLKLDHECGDFGQALEGYSEEAEKLEMKICGLQVELYNCYHSIACLNGAKPERAKAYAKKMVAESK